MTISKPLAAVIDAVLVVTFAAFGRGAHSEGLGVSEVANTAWPFLVGLAAGWAVLLLTSRPHTAISTGVLLWASTVIIGMAIRGGLEGKIPHWSFLIVAGTVTAIFLLGWRALAALISSRQRA